MNMLPEGLVSPEAILNALKNEKESHAFIDVRSEGEFLDCAIPGFINIPILNNNERHEVGITYKKMGQDAAVKLGFDLVTPDRSRRELLWIAEIEKSDQKSAIVTCWRGGMRSKLACEWIKDRGVKALRVIGGYKAIRRELLKVMEHLPDFLILSGMTGSGKTKLLKRIPQCSVDLEGLAHHRGSTFGRMLGNPQPKQATFENRILFELRGVNSEILLEDESVRIGNLSIPKMIKEKMNSSDVIVLKTPIENRVRWIFDEYVFEPSQKGFSNDENFAALLRSLGYLKDRLGGKQFNEMKESLDLALKNGWLEFSNHAVWIERMLVDYYDALYLHAFNRLNRKVTFEGNEEECFQWIQDRFDSRKL